MFSSRVWIYCFIQIEYLCVSGICPSMEGPSSCRDEEVVRVRGALWCVCVCVYVCVCLCLFRAIGFCPLTHHLRPWWFNYFMLSFNIPFSFLPECFQKARVWLTQTRLPYPKPFQSWHPSAGIRCFIWPSNTWQWGRFGDPSCQTTQVGWSCCQRVADHTSACCWTTNSCQFSVQ